VKVNHGAIFWRKREAAALWSTVPCVRKGLPSRRVSATAAGTDGCGLVAPRKFDGHFWFDRIGKATPYHARQVHPQWVGETPRLDRIGVHTFYRTPPLERRRQSAGVWGDASAKAEKL
jgi:hypothetical protein